MISEEKIQRLIKEGELIPWEKIEEEFYRRDPSARIRVEAGVKEMDIRCELRNRRKALKLSQQQMAKRSGVPQRTISEIEQGKRNVTVGTLAKLAAGMGKKIEIRFVD